jgi:hypothetical protein
MNIVELKEALEGLAKAWAENDRIGEVLAKAISEVERIGRERSDYYGSFGL